MADQSRITVRRAAKEDMADVLLMIQELADFEKMPDGPKLTVDDLIRDGGFDSNDANGHPLFFCFIAEEISPTTNRIGDDGNVDLTLNRQPMTRNLLNSKK
ncbi:uncharacterized protein LOC119076628 isoform X5 [Bradysia coprophila]|uniref:uncharacterized protein LOC119076628 isoform X5 n=1 Tax=Bradysia coprophila TaxID=38358 RepID=UPI00187D8026|nr:uncharacterized protein LOC119076628 isoform X5 [Bradysia coprophila]